MDNTIYDVCYETLAYATENIINLVGDEIEKISVELLKFLTTDNSRYEEIFDQTISFEFPSNKRNYKKIMMLIIISSSYYLSLYYIKNGMNVDINEEIVEEIESLNYSDIFKLFYSWRNNSKVIDYIEDYCDFYEKNYIFRNNCMEEAIKQNKLSIINKINPFEILNFINYLDPNMLLESEKMIQKFIDMYDSSLCYCGLDELGEENNYENFDDFVADIIREKISEQFVTEEKIEKFYSYIFSNIYEGFITYYNADKLIIKRYPLIGKELLKEDINFDYLYEKILNDNDFLIEIIDFFIEINDNMYENDLITRRLDFKKIGNQDVLKKLDPFYEEEEVVYAKILEKRYPN